MSMSDPIADLLTRIRNAIRAGHATTLVPASKIKENICRVMQEEGYLDAYRTVDVEGKPMLEVTIRYVGYRESVIQGIRRVSRPSLRRYVGSDEILPVRSGLGISIVSTSHGVMTGKQARQQRVGGELLCEVW